MNVNDALLIENINLLKEKKIIIYGTGDVGKYAYYLTKGAFNEQIKIECFCVSDERHNDKDYYSIKILAFSEVQRNYKTDDIIMIIATNITHAREIADFIAKRWPDLTNIVSWFGYSLAIAQNIKEPAVDSSFRNWFYVYRNSRNALWSNTTMTNIHDLYRDNPVLVYSLSRTASIAMSNSLRKKGIDNVHLHYIYCVAHEDEQMLYTREYNGIKPELRKLAQHYINHTNDYEIIKIVSIVRDPIARSLSHWTHILYDGFSVNLNAWIDRSNIMENVEQFLMEELNTGKNGGMFEWYDKEIRNTYGIDVFEYPFNREAGYSIIKKNNIEILLLTMESLNKNERIIADFFCIDEFNMEWSNEGEKAWSSFLYSYIKNNIVIDDTIWDFYYKHNSGMRHFYTDEQIKRMGEKWKT